MPLIKTLLKSILSACLGWDQTRERDRGLGELGGNGQLACKRAGAGVPNTGLLPDSVSSQAPGRSQLGAVAGAYTSLVTGARSIKKGTMRL